MRWCFARVQSPLSASARRRAIRSSRGWMDDITAANTTSAQPIDGSNWNATKARAPAEAGTMSE